VRVSKDYPELLSAVGEKKKREGWKGSEIPPAGGVSRPRVGEAAHVDGKYQHSDGIELRYGCRIL